jgi:hypothetical protein
MVKRALERNEPFGLLNADASVGTLASITVRLFCWLIYLIENYAFFLPFFQRFYRALPFSHSYPSLPPSLPSSLAPQQEVYRMEEDTGISILKITGTRRFEVQASHVADDSFGLLHATSAKFFEEDPVEDLEELESLRVQARACLASSLVGVSMMGPPPPPSFLMQTGQQHQRGGREGGRRRWCLRRSRLY